MSDASQDIRDRAFVFACAVASRTLQLEPRPGIRCLIDQLLKSAPLNLGPSAELKDLSGEAEQIARILGAIIVKTKFRMRTGYAVFAFCILNFALLFS